MNELQALILGIVEGLTEFVPVSSTGHLILATRALGLSGEGVDSFDVVIQLGALLAAVLYYRHILYQTAVGLVRGEAAAQRLFLSLCVAAVPALGLGYFFHKKIKHALFGPLPVAAALVVGGLVMIVMDRWRRHHPRPDINELSQVTPKQALVVGLCQTASLWPGTSRSMASIVGGQLAGLSTPVAADFSFLLAIPTLGAATVYDLLKNFRSLIHDTGKAELLIGLSASFVVGWLVIAAFLRYLRRFGLGAFGYYRIALGVLVLFLLR